MLILFLWYNIFTASLHWQLFSVHHNNVDLGKLFHVLPLCLLAVFSDADVEESEQTTPVPEDTDTTAEPSMVSACYVKTLKTI